MLPAIRRMIVPAVSDESRAGGAHGGNRPPSSPPRLVIIVDGRDARPGRAARPITAIRAAGWTACHPQGRSAAKDARSALTRRPSIQPWKKLGAAPLGVADLLPADPERGHRHDRQAVRPDRCISRPHGPRGATGHPVVAQIKLGTQRVRVSLADGHDSATSADARHQGGDVPEGCEAAGKDLPDCREAPGSGACSAGSPV